MLQWKQGIKPTCGKCGEIVSSILHIETCSKYRVQIEALYQLIRINVDKEEVWQMGVVELLQKEEEIMRDERNETRKVWMIEIVGGLCLLFKDFLEDIKTEIVKGKKRRRI